MRPGAFREVDGTLGSKFWPADVPFDPDFPGLGGDPRRAQMDKEYREAKLQAEKEAQEAKRKLEDARKAEAAKKKAEEKAEAERVKAAAAEAKAAEVAKREADFLAEKDKLAGLASSKKTGAELAKDVAAMQPSALGFAAAFFAARGADLGWLKSEGDALKVVAPEGDVQKQADLLFAAQRHFHGLDFPKDANGKALVQNAFKTLFLTEVVDIDAFEAWRDDESEEREAIPGKIKTLTQTTDFFSYLDTVDDDDDDDDDED